MSARKRKWGNFTIESAEETEAHIAEGLAGGSVRLDPEVEDWRGLAEAEARGTGKTPLELQRLGRKSTRASKARHQNAEADYHECEAVIEEYLARDPKATAKEIRPELEKRLKKEISPSTAGRMVARVRKEHLGPAG